MRRRNHCCHIKGMEDQILTACGSLPTEDGKVVLLQENIQSWTVVARQAALNEEHWHQSQRRNQGGFQQRPRGYDVGTGLAVLEIHRRGWHASGCRDLDKAPPAVTQALKQASGTVKHRRSRQAGSSMMKYASLHISDREKCLPRESME